MAGWRRVLGVLETSVGVAEPTGDDAVASPRGPATVTFERVAYSYPDGPPVLQDVDLHVAAGTSVAVVGATGSGKTTLAKLVARFMDPTSGTVRLDGVDLRRVASHDLRRRVVLVPQEGFLFDGTLSQNVAYGLRDGRGGGPDPEPEVARRVQRVVDELGLDAWVAELPAGLDTPVGQRGELLSAGERQLVALARARLADGDLLLLDEATSAVDPVAEVRIARALRELARGRTTLTIAHRLSTAEAADVVVVVHAGRVVETGTHAELLALGGHYAAMHAAWVSQTR